MPTRRRVIGIVNADEARVVADVPGRYVHVCLSLAVVSSRLIKGVLTVDRSHCFTRARRKLANGATTPYASLV